ncbi:GroES-like protein [Cryphonectria parasitica EP155]|uniref:GroES-like protein n=1 Tax=Cryphonectria parasitica (strain ATCC 38755 / EP155) TaxID=660469 RepID=A0A9P4Y5U9_CRYP1|nr:GroES-like protein [Cryphonectria parasitica EP155]KAF3767263.1 GroES-like protein [Cryphonectria parasitica EP155]
MTSTTTYKALVTTGVGESTIQDLPVPRSVREGYVLVRTKAVALNPADLRALYNEDGSVVGKKFGCDFAGVVEEVGEGVTKYVVGDRICGLAFAGDLEHGAFGEYVLSPVDPVTLKIPDNLSFEEAATLGVGVTTVGQGLYQNLKLPLPNQPSSEPFPLLINGGSTMMGVLGIQFAKLSNAIVLATSSPHNFDYLRSLGADYVYDYHIDPATLADRIRADLAASSSRSSKPLALAWDCLVTPDSTRLIALAAGAGGAGSSSSSSSSSSPPKKMRYGVILPVDKDAVQALYPDVQWEIGLTIGYSVFGEEFTRGKFKLEASREDWEFGKKFWDLTAGLLAEGRVKAGRVETNRLGKGLEGVRLGLEELKAGKVSATKLVYTFLEG